MSTPSTADVSFIIDSINEETGQIVIRPHSPLFKNTPDQYPAYSYDLSIFDPTQDFNTQVARLIYPVVQKIIATESTDYSNIIAAANDSLNTPVTVSLTPEALPYSTFSVVLSSPNPGTPAVISTPTGQVKFVV
jgi:hypothetical protein